MAAVPKVIDSDRHVREPVDLWERYMSPELRDRGPKFVEGYGRAVMMVDGIQIPPDGFYEKGDNSGTYSQSRYDEYSKRGFDASVHLEAMDVDGIGYAVMLPSSGLTFQGISGVDPVVTTDATRAYNTWLSEHVEEGGGRMFGVGMIDPRDIAGARLEARRCIEELGFVGVMLRPNPVEGRPWYDEEYDPLWAEIQDLDVPVCFHEGGVVLLPQFGPQHDRMGTVFQRWHVMTHAVEQQAAMVAMVMGGVFERHPQLRAGYLECGASWLPYYMWRMDEHAELEHGGMSSEHVYDLPLEPSEYVLRNCFVGTEADEEYARFTYEVTGNRNVMWASDFPHPDAKFPGSLDVLRGLPGMEGERERRVLWDNCLDFYGARLADRVSAGE